MIPSIQENGEYRGQESQHGLAWREGQTTQQQASAFTRNHCTLVPHAGVGLHVHGGMAPRAPALRPQGGVVEKEEGADVPRGPGHPCGALRLRCGELQAWTKCGASQRQAGQRVACDTCLRAPHRGGGGSGCSFPDQGTAGLRGSLWKIKPALSCPFSFPTSP